MENNVQSVALIWPSRSLISSSPSWMTYALSGFPFWRTILSSFSFFDVGCNSSSSPPSVFVPRAIFFLRCRGWANEAHQLTLWKETLRMCIQSAVTGRTVRTSSLTGRSGNWQVVWFDWLIEWFGGGACGDTEDRQGRVEATNEIGSCERGSHVHRRHVNENAAKKKKSKNLFIWFYFIRRLGSILG